MKRPTFILLALLVLFAQIAIAKPVQKDVAPQPRDNSSTKVQVPAPAASSAVDTTYLLGGPGSWDGSFETPGGQPDWHGWTHEDASTNSPENHWHVSTYMADQIAGKGPGNHAMFCGDETIPACDPPDTIGGYGNKWFEEIEWVHSVVDTSQSVIIRLTGSMNFDIEGGYDFLYLMLQRGINKEVLASWDGFGTTALDFTTVIDPGEFSGSDGDELRLMWFFTSDGGWSDTDCSFPTRGACQIDDLSVYLDGNLTTFDDFEPGNPLNWSPVIIPGVGDFSNLRNNLGDIDPCSSNTTYQVNFVDDGTVVPGTGGMPCITWCYGTGGWIVNNDGGLLAEYPLDYHMYNRVISPPLAWPVDAHSADLAFDVYRHEPFITGSAGIFYGWRVRSTASSDPADLEAAPWQGTDLYFGGPDYHRADFLLNRYLVPGCQWVQVALEADERGFALGYGQIDGPDGTPAPYFDNVAVRAWDPEGPRISMGINDLIRDAFPETGVLDAVNLASNSCRVDARYWISSIQAPRDSIQARVTALRHGATIAAPAELHWVMKGNPVFDTVRTGSPDGNGLQRGSVPGIHDVNNDLWKFDLPDSGWFFPGDLLRYYVVAGTELDGDIRYSTWPADTTGVLDFTPGSSFNTRAEARALPSLGVPVGGEFPKPPIVLVNNVSSNFYQVDIVDVSAWVDALTDLGLVERTDFDILQKGESYVMRDPSEFDHYSTVIIVSGSFGPTFDDPSRRQIILDWLDLGGRRALFSGESLILPIDDPLINRLGVQFEDSDIAQVNGGARELQVTPAPGGGVLPAGQTWRLSDGCPDNRFTQAITAVSGVGQMAASLDPVGSTGGLYAGLVATDDIVLDNRTLVMPFDLARIEGYAGGGKNSISPQADLLNSMLVWLGTDGVSASPEVPGIRQVAVNAYPNPFNPSTTIVFELPQASEVSLDIYDLQGRLVRRLLDESPYISGSHKQVWDGRDGDGRATSSGVYFYRFTAGDQKRVGKLTLLK